MVEILSYEQLLGRMLARVPAGLDKRPGSIIHDACAPAAVELAQMYMDLGIAQNLFFADTASGEYLTRRAAEFGVHRRSATRARRRGRFRGTGGEAFAVPLDSRYSQGELVYRVVSEREPGDYVLECETAGQAGNLPSGPLLPLNYTTGLADAELLEVLAPGDEEESDTELYTRLIAMVNEPAFGGNVADYKQMLTAMTGVGAVKVYPGWAGGGTVKCTLISADWSAPSPTLLEELQEVVDPEAVSGLGLGQAPIGHQVTLTGVSEVAVDVETTLTLAIGVTLGQVQEAVEQVVADYLRALCREWSTQSQLTVRTAQLDARILTVPGIEDVTLTALNDSSANLLLTSDEIPVLGAVTLHDQ